MSTLVFYNKETGALRKVVQGDEETQRLYESANPDLGLIVQSDELFSRLDPNIFDSYVDIKTSTFKPKKTFELEWNLPKENLKQGENVVISNIPKGTNVTWPDAVNTIEQDGIIEFTIDMLRNNYVFSFEHPHYYNLRETCNVTS